MGGKYRLAAAVMLSLLALAPAAHAALPCKLLKLGELPITMEGARPVIAAQINGQPVKLIADSGAFFSLLDSDQAKKLDLKQNSVGGDRLMIRGVNGAVKAKVGTAHEFKVLGQTFQDVDFVTAPETFDWNVTGYLGQNFLNISSAEYDLANGAIRLFRVEGCEDTALAYWSAGKPFTTIAIDETKPGMRRIRGKVFVNGVELPAVFDTGAGRSMLTLEGAEKAGIKPGDRRLQPDGITGGLGRRLEQSWIAPIQSFRIGDEEIRNTRLRVGEIDLNDADMLIGADFFLSHRMFVANTQRKMYLSYNGGPVFRLDPVETAPGAAPAPPVKVAPGEETSTSDDAPKDADALARRAHASDARGEYAQAIADYTRAIEADPKNADSYFGRARTYVRQDRRDLALADFDRGLHLRPDDLDALIGRGSVHVHEHRPELARRDFDAAKKLDPTKSPEIAAIYLDGEMYPQAIADLDERIANLPKGDDGAGAYNDRCWARALWDQELDKALADCSRSLKLAPRSYSVLDSQALVYLRMGRFADAIANYNAILYRQPRLAWSLYCRGLAEQKLGRTSEGETDIRKAKGIDPAVADKARKYGFVADASPAKP